MKIEIKSLKICGIQRKQCSEENLQQLYACIRKEERSIINNLNFYHSKLEKQEQIKFNMSRRKEIIKSRAKINKIKTGN